MKQGDGMTENKRLIVDEDYNIVDTETGEGLDDNQIFDLVNSLSEENEQLKQINRNLGDFRRFITEQNVSNEKERKNLQLQMLRLYNYFENYFEDTMSPNAFGEMWDNVKEDERWD